MELMFTTTDNKVAAVKIEFLLILKTKAANFQKKIKTSYLFHRFFHPLSRNDELFHVSQYPQLNF